MIKEELKNKCTERAKIFQQAMEGCHSSSPMDCIEWFADRIVELEKKISILLSCKNCPDNKGGLLCQKEYEDKCLAQKIKFIKELQEENAELKAYNEKLLNGDIEKHNKIAELGKENSRLKQIILGNEMEIAAKDETIEELKKQVQGYLINYSDNT